MTGLQRIIVVPRNGYINRIQAWASSSILASQLGVPCTVMWEQESIAAASATDFFTQEAVATEFISRAEVDDLLMMPHEELPRYLNVLGSTGIAVLAGHDRGEQYFMPQLRELLNTSADIHTLVIIAGGKFSLPSTKDFTSLRADFYSALPWNSAVHERVALRPADAYSYSGLHIRGTDRALAAPTSSAVVEALSLLASSAEGTSLFIAADTQEARIEWEERALSLGFMPWSLAPRSLDRSSVIAGIDAMADWICLGQSSRIVYSATSSYAEEAAVATHNFNECISLEASRARQSLRKTARIFHSAQTYLSRHH